MCGIGGIFYFSQKKVQKSQLNEINRLMEHRGPDGDGLFIDNSLGLAHRRLKIIDLSESGKQPMTSHNGRFVISYNGECYNYKELRNELKKDGVLFRGESDTEVVLESFARWGSNALKKFNGMFAMAIWDKKQRTLTLARDRFGIKPLYFYHNKEKFIFSSEIKPLLASGVEFSLNHKHLYDFFTLRYVPSDETLYKGIKSFKSAHFMVIDQEKIQSKCYWNLQLTEKKKPFSSEYLYDLLFSSVKYRLNSDVPIGLFLSGGIDSSSIAELTRKSGLSTDTFTFNVEGKYSEIKQAKEISLSCGHNPYSVGHIDLNDLEKIILSLEEPIGDSIILPSYSLATEAKKRVKVILSGEGADEIFNGYVHHSILYWLNKLKNIRKIIAFSSKYLPKEILNTILPYSEGLDKQSLSKIIKDIYSFNGDMNDCRNFVRMFTR